MRRIDRLARRAALAEARNLDIRAGLAGRRSRDRLQERADQARARADGAPRPLRDRIMAATMALVLLGAGFGFLRSCAVDHGLIDARAPVEIIQVVQR